MTDQGPGRRPSEDATGKQSKVKVIHPDHTGDNNDNEWQDSLGDIVDHAPYLMNQGEPPNFLVNAPSPEEESESSYPSHSALGRMDTTDRSSASVQDSECLHPVSKVLQVVTEADGFSSTEIYCELLESTHGTEANVKEDAPKLEIDGPMADQASIVGGALPSAPCSEPAIKTERKRTIPHPLPPHSQATERRGDLCNATGQAIEGRGQPLGSTNAEVMHAFGEPPNPSTNTQGSHVHDEPRNLPARSGTMQAGGDIPTAPPNIRQILALRQRQFRMRCSYHKLRAAATFRNLINEEQTRLEAVSPFGHSTPARLLALSCIDGCITPILVNVSTRRRADHRNLTTLERVQRVLRRTALQASRHHVYQPDPLYSRLTNQTFSRILNIVTRIWGTHLRRPRLFVQCRDAAAAFAFFMAARAARVYCNVHPRDRRPMASYALEADILTFVACVIRSGASLEPYSEMPESESMDG